MTWPFENDTSKVVKRISRASIKANKVKNVFLVITISVITFLIFTLLCTGFSYRQNFNTMEGYLQGTTSDGYVKNTSSDYSERLEEQDFLSNVGEQSFIGLAAIPNTNDFCFAINYYSEVEWETHILPTISGFVGHYPEASNEIALPQNVLEQLEIENPQVGMEVPLVIDHAGQTEIETFTLSGFFTDYVSNSLRPLGTYSGNIMAAGIYCTEQNLNMPAGNIIVSKEFAEAATQKETLLTFNISSGQNMTYEKAAQMINELLELPEKQGAMVFHRGSVEGSSLAGIGIALFVVCIVMFCGYLCIYNIVQISIVKDTQMFGQFKTIGMTPRQINLLVKRQNSLLCIVGIPLGLLVGIVCSRAIIPYFISTLLSGGGYSQIMPNDVSLNPLVFLITILFSALTVFISCSKPAKSAGKISPISAMKFSYSDTAVKTYKRTTHGNVALMAYRNVFREKKKSRVVFISLSTGLTLLICVLTVLSSPDWNKFLDIQSPDDFLFTDTSIENIDSTEEAQFNQEFVQQISAISGVTKIEVTQALEVNFDETERHGIWKPFIEDKAISDERDYDTIAERCYATAVTLSDVRLQTFQPHAEEDFSEQDIKNFDSGSDVYLLCTEKLNYPSYVIGQTITVYNKYTGQEASYRVAGFLEYPNPDSVANGNEYPNHWGRIRYNSEHSKYNVTSVYMSEAGMLRLTDAPIIQEVRVQADSQQEPAIKQQLMELRNGISQRHLISRSDLLPLYQPVIKMMVTIGVTFSCILFLIGILNFVNTIVTSIYSRQKEIAALEGIGMSKKQIKKMLMFEGMYYCLFTIAIVGTFGILLTYGVIQAVQQELYYFTFNPPLFLFSAIFIALLIVCLTVPFTIYRQVSKQPLSDRLKTN